MLPSLDGRCYPWESGGCEWTFRFVWSWMSSLVRLDIVVLLLMLLYVLRVFIRVSWQCYEAQRSTGVGSAGRRTRVATLNIQVGNVSSIVTTAPYLGLAGTCIGILDALVGGVMQKDAFRSLVATKMGVALVPTAVAMLVAILATCSHKYLRTLTGLLANDGFDEGQQRGRFFRRASGLPPAKQFSKLPAFALLAAPGLAIAITGIMVFESLRTSTGFYVGFAEANCEYGVLDNPIVLHITDSGKLYLNYEGVELSGLANRLSMIYSMRAHREIYMLADPGVSFRTVAETLDALEDAPSTDGNHSIGARRDKLGIKVRLITPNVMSVGCRPVRAKVF